MTRKPVKRKPANPVTDDTMLVPYGALVTAKTEIHQNIDGEWVTPPRKNFYRACCDCGLTHREEYRVHKGKVQYRVWRDKAETRAERLRTKKGPRR
jgi:hypothetical protein